MDVFTEAARSIALQSAQAPFLAFSAGTLSSLGPCVAPRLLAVASCVGARPPRQARIVVAAFLAGLVAAYASFGLIASLLGRLLDISRWTYDAVALALLAGGIVTLIQAEPQAHDACRTQTAQTRNQTPSLGGVFLLGASFALVIAPCCTPLVATIVAYASDVGDPFYGASMLAFFALGHGLPVAIVGLSAGTIVAHLRKTASHQATAIASGTIMLVLSAFYWCLA
jgi:cytochrome c-type biogenesis protein